MVHPESATGQARSIWVARPTITVPNYRMRTAADLSAAHQRRACERQFLALVGARNPYPDVEDNYDRATPYGLTIGEVAREFSRCRTTGWEPWETLTLFMSAPWLTSQAWHDSE